MAKVEFASQSHNYFCKNLLEPFSLACLSFSSCCSRRTPLITDNSVSILLTSINLYPPCFGTYKCSFSWMCLAKSFSFLEYFIWTSPLSNFCRYTVKSAVSSPVSPPLFSSSSLLMISVFLHLSPLFFRFWTLFFTRVFASLLGVFLLVIIC